MLIDKQLGHGGAQVERSLEIHRMIVGSKTGRRHYLDLNSALFDASLSATAVRQLLNDAEAGLERQGTPLLFCKPEAGSTRRIDST